MRCVGHHHTLQDDEVAKEDRLVLETRSSNMIPSEYELFTIILAPNKPSLTISVDTDSLMVIHRVLVREERHLTRHLKDHMREKSNMMMR